MQSFVQFSSIVVTYDEILILPDNTRDHPMYVTTILLEKKMSAMVVFALETSETVKTVSWVSVDCSLQSIYHSTYEISTWYIVLMNVNLIFKTCQFIKQYRKHIETGQDRHDEKGKRQAGVNNNRDENRAVVCLQLYGSVVSSILPQSLPVCDSTIWTFLWLQGLCGIISTVTINVMMESSQRAQLFLKNKWVHFSVSLLFDICLSLALCPFQNEYITFPLLKHCSP